MGERRVVVCGGGVRSSVHLRPRAPYAFEAALAYLATSPSAVVERVDTQAGVYRRAVTLGGRDVLVTLRSTGTVARPRLALEVRAAHGERLGEDALDRAERFARRVFLLDEDPAPFLTTAAGDPILHELVRRFSGLRPVLIADPFETLLWAVAGQQVNVSFARTLKLALVAACGRRISVAGEEYAMMPPAHEVARLDAATLAARQFSRQKAAYTIGLAQAVARGDLDFASLRKLPPQEATAALTRFRGVGRWTAEYVLMRGLGARDVIPAGDLGLQQAIGRAYGLGRTATEGEVRAIAEPWAGWRGWAAFYWWLSIQVERFAVRMPV